MTICEIVVDGGCNKGTYGYGCNQSCGMCFAGNKSCSTIDGQCTVGCEAGWQGGTCKEGCNKRTYGYGCNETCGMCFSGNNSCSTIDGQCKIGCEAGWQGGTCKQGCNKGTHGFGCNETCGKCFSGNNSCSTIDGICKLGCEAGWQGGTCKQGCNKGTYGYGCNETCGMCFGGNNSCSTIDGQCKFGCEAGWMGEACKQVCNKGIYGYGCNETCGNCFSGNNSCSAIDGKCKVGCEAGWQGGTCKQECERGTYGYGCNETCGMCKHGNDSCSTINGTCIDGCQAGWKDGKCILGMAEKSIQRRTTDNIITIGVVVPVTIVLITLITVFLVLRMRRKRSTLEVDVSAEPIQKQYTFCGMIKEVECNDRELQYIENMGVPKEHLTQCIPVVSFWSHVMKKKVNKEKCELEFQELTVGLTKPYDTALANCLKNRFESMYPYDFNRIVLKRISSQNSDLESDSDYINASHVKGFEVSKCYIAAQGPIEQTVDDFWWMVWQEETECIVMLTSFSEIGMEKCIQYWPDEDEHMYGEVTVKILRNEYLHDFVKRDFQITVGAKSRNVTQFHYKAWPEEDVPDTVWSLLEFWKAVRKHNTYANGPIVVHCSAGVGRTGTFIALDIIYDEACERGEVGIMRCIENLREQRANMVQTAKQFIFLHDVVAEALGFQTMPVSKNEFSDVVMYLMEKDETSGLTPLQRQYNMLLQVGYEQEESNVSVYSNAEIIQSESIWLPNLSGKDAYIALTNVADEILLTIIRQSNIKCLIVLDNISPTDILFSTGVKQSIALAGLTLTCKEKEDIGTFERKQFSITSDEKKESHHLLIFLLKTFEELFAVPSDSNLFLSLLEDVGRWHPNPNEMNPILLFSRREVNICGLMYILLKEKERIRTDGEIHILQTSGDMLARSRALLPTFEQYVFVYKCLATDALPLSTRETSEISKVREIP
ncbi:hypothetical protein CHS0354_040082 [Potamilus streckersoni]|uniref:protein-tyrosine-phosphatase n=1 Tax=Potamilus streckersoni TaxID=2493646 RepID=A0AAE0W180_9BIVA|nr:hypothetical protein CHS0354_040082 [Potamilus streckersoni]